MLIEEYLRCYRLPGTIHAICGDYRAAASVDLEHDARRSTAGMFRKKSLRGKLRMLYSRF
jgi:haloacetate dehalogenase